LPSKSKSTKENVGKNQPLIGKKQENDSRRTWTKGKGNSCRSAITGVELITDIPREKGHPHNIQKSKAKTVWNNYIEEEMGNFLLGFSCQGKTNMNNGSSPLSTKVSPREEGG